MTMSKFYSLLLIFSHIFLVECNKYNCDRGPGGNGMGTVLFTAADVHKQCWSPDEIAVLTTRMILEDLLPEVTILHIDSNAFIDDIVNYFRLLIEVVKSTTHGRKKHITLMALTDLLGGYLQFAVLPIARHAFYAGHVDFTSMLRIIQLYEELKWFLRTNGQGWSRPIESRPVLQVDPINFPNETPKGGKSCCDKLIFYESEKHAKEDNCTVTQTDVFFPLPFFDSKVRPTSIAVPFRKYALRNIESRKASYLLLKFFISAVQCMKDKRSSKEAVNKFQNNFYSWIEREVTPKLNDDKFYSAFGGILRVEETLKAMGAKATSETTCGPEGEEEMGVVSATGPHKGSKSTIIIVVMLVTIILWFIIGTAFICYRIRKNQSGDRQDKSKKQDYNTTSNGSSKWSLFSKSVKSVFKSDDGSHDSKYSASQTSKTTPYSSSLTSEYEAEERHKGKKKRITVCQPPFAFTHGKSNKPAVIEAKTTMKKLPSISEITEMSATRHDDTLNSSKLPYGEPMFSSSREDVRKVSFSRRPSMEMCPVPCPRHVGTSFSTSRTLTAQGKDVAVQPSASEVYIDECWCNLYPEDYGEQHVPNGQERGRRAKPKKKETDQADRTHNEVKKSILIPEDLWTPEESDYIHDKTVKTERSVRNGQNGEKSFRKGQNGDRTGRNIDKFDQSRHSRLEEVEEEGSETREMSRAIPAEEQTNENVVVSHSSDIFMQENSVAEESATEKSAAENSVEENSVPDSTDDGGGAVRPSGTSPHIHACHSSLTGAYANQKRSSGHAPYIFGYDFQTSSSSDISDEETDVKTSTSK